jgi:hypothetical protein
MSNLPIDQQQGILKDIGRLTYNIGGGGYRFNDANYKGNLPANFVDPNANQFAANLYGNTIGNLPTRNYGSLALERLYQSSGQRPTQLPSYNQRFQSAGISGGYQGPFAFNGYDPFAQYR